MELGVDVIHAAVYFFFVAVLDVALGFGELVDFAEVFIHSCFKRIDCFSELFGQFLFLTIKDTIVFLSQLDELFDISLDFRFEDLETISGFLHHLGLFFRIKR